MKKASKKLIDACFKLRSSAVLRFFAVLLLILTVSAAVILLSSGKKAKEGETGFMRVCVHDGETDMPLSGARVVIPETGYEYVTDDEGFTPVMELPVYYDKHYSNILKQDYGLITVIVYHEGYVPYALYFTHVEPNVLRRGPNVWLFPGDGVPFTVIEGPDEGWSQRLIEEFEP